MDKEDKTAALTIVLTMLGFVMLFVVIAIALTICHEVAENGNAKRCAEYNYNCNGE